MQASRGYFPTFVIEKTSTIKEKLIRCDLFRGEATQYTKTKTYHYS